MRNLKRTKRANQDLILIWHYIAQHNPEAANAQLEAIERKCQLLLRYPKIGRSTDDIRKGSRTLPCGAYVILYRENSEGIEIVRVVHGARDLRQLT
jgi:toxin ParE1/3/4